MSIYAAAIFLSAFLLFEIEPMIAKFILPWFGGSAAVWSAALLFFQLGLLGGYFYAHCLIRYLPVKKQLYLHFALLTASLAVLPVIPSAYWKPVGGADPTLRILLLLAATIGLPYMLLSSTSPLLQAWFVRARKGAIPYRLFALSNFGSMLALLSYPFWVEPRYTLRFQAKAWSLGYVAFAAICAWAGWKDRGAPDSPAQGSLEDAAPPRPRLSSQILWVALAACASVLLLSTTTLMTQNIAAIPLLWIAPLSIYLLSFILCFEGDRIYQRYIFLPLLIVALRLYPYAMYHSQNNDDIRSMLAALSAALFICCMVCHGELARRKPHPRYLTQFYLMVSAGGAAGGLFVALGAPHLFRDYLETPIAIAACALLAVCALWHNQAGEPRAGWLRTAMLAAAVAFAVYLGRNEIRDARAYVLNARNFYGVLHVRDDPPMYGAVGQRVLVHGTINHGTEIMGPGSGRIPTSYFGSGSGVSRAIRAKQDSGPIRIGVLGLGAGVTASLARAGDTLHYYEINPLIREIANSEFTFFRSCPAAKQIYMGDGRLVLERLPSERLDVLAIDAFSSDAIPLHLLTREAFQIYLRHMKPDGVIAAHISNRYLDLEPVVSEAAAGIGWRGITIYDDGDAEGFYISSTWMVLSPRPEFFDKIEFQDAGAVPMHRRQSFRPWTDDYSNIVQIFHW